MEDEKAGLETRISNLKQEEKENEVKNRQATLSIKESESLIKKYEEQQLQVRNNREYGRPNKEIEAQKLRIQESNQDIESIKQTESLNALAIEEAEKRLQDLTAILDTKKKNSMTC